MNNMTHVDYNGIPLQAVEHQGETWLTAEGLARGLGFGQKRAAVNLYNRHVDEFTDEMTCVINLMTQAQRRSVRVFSPRGCWLIAMFANTHNAKRFRVWVLDVLEARQSEHPSDELLERIETMAAALRRANPQWDLILRCQRAGLNNRQIGRVLECDESTVRSYKTKMRGCGLIADTRLVH